MRIIAVQEQNGGRRGDHREAADDHDRDGPMWNCFHSLALARRIEGAKQIRLMKIPRRGERSKSSVG